MDIVKMLFGLGGTWRIPALGRGRAELFCSHKVTKGLSAERLLCRTRPLPCKAVRTTGF
jgi:hypothetical protein